jgi:hypothetical protein
MDFKMATSFIEFKGRGFWSPDALLEIWLYRLSKLMRASPDAAARAYAEHARIQATVGMHGCINLGLDELDEAVRASLEDYANRIDDEIIADPSLVSAATLNALSLGGDGTFMRDVPPQNVLALSRMIVALVSQRWPHTASDEEALHSSWLPKHSFE